MKKIDKMMVLVLVCLVPGALLVSRYFENKLTSKTISPEIKAQIRSGQITPVPMNLDLEIISVNDATESGDLGLTGKTTKTETAVYYSFIYKLKNSEIPELGQQTNQVESQPVSTWAVYPDSDGLFTIKQIQDVKADLIEIRLSQLDQTAVFLVDLGTHLISRY